MQFFLQNVQNEIFMILKMIKYDMKFTRTSFWIKPKKKKKKKKKNTTLIIFFVTVVGNYCDVIIEGL